MNSITEILHSDVKNPSSITNAKDEFIILDNPELTSSFSYPYKNEWIIATLCEKGYAKGKVNMREYYIEGNCLILILPGQVISKSELSPDFKGKIILLSPQFADNVNLGSMLLLTKSLERKPFFVFPDEAAQAFRNYINLCKSLITMEGSSDILQVLQLLSKGFFIGMEDYIASQKPLPRLSKVHGPELVEEFLNLVETEYRHHRDLSYYAERLCKSAKYLSRIIMESTGKNATDWIERCVILDAKAQLLSTKKRISEISDDLDFPTPSFFGKYFKRVTGLSPRAFREANAQAPNKGNE